MRAHTGALCRCATIRATVRRVKKPKSKPPAVASEPRAPAPAPVLDARQRKQLRALAHHLEPIVRVGHAGATDAVVVQVAQALADHELIKVRLYEPEDKRALAAELALRSLSALCGLVGHTVILFRPRPKQSKIALSGGRLEPRPARANASKSRANGRRA
jgi:RNA-binding protein